MIDPLFLTIEFIGYALFIGCLIHALKRGSSQVLELLMAAVFGVLLELAMIQQSSAYHYGRFLIMIGDATLMNGAGWAAIIYSSMEFTRRLEMPAYARPILNALLALNIDLAMDTIAIRLVDHVNNDMGLWTWGGVPFDQQWFGVPWGNFWGWFWVISLFSGFVYLLRRWRQYPVLRWLYPPLALLLSLVGLIVITQAHGMVIAPALGEATGTLAVVIGGLLLVLLVRPRLKEPGPPEPAILAVPLGFHLMFIIPALLQGIYAETPALAVIGIVMLVVGMAVHLWPWWVWRKSQSTVGHELLAKG